MDENVPRVPSYCAHMNSDDYCLLHESYLLTTVLSTSYALIRLQHYATYILDNFTIHCKNEGLEAT